MLLINKFNYSDGPYLIRGVLLWFLLLKKCQLHTNFQKNVSIRSLSDRNY